MAKPQPDYLAEVQQPGKWLAIALLMVSASVSCACLAVCVGGAIVRPKGLPNSAIFGSLAVFALLSWASVWMLIRMLRDARAANTRTNMPVWFIQGFGALLLIGIVIAAFSARQPLLLIEGCGVAFAMLGIRRLLNAYDAEANQG